MRLINKKPYLTLAQCVQCGLVENTILTANKRGSKAWDIIKDPDDSRMILVGYEGLKPEYRRMVDERYGNVYEQVARQPILEMVVNDAKAVEFYKRYRFGGNNEKFLPLHNTDKHVGGTVNKYVRAASWLNFFSREDLKQVAKGLGINLTKLYEQAGVLIKVEKENGKMAGYTGIDVLPGEFPGTYQNLMRRVDEYRKGGYECLINGRIDNKNSSKLGKMRAGSVEQGAESVLRQAQDDSAEGVIALPEGGKGGGNGLVLVPKTGNKRGAFDPEVEKKQTAVMRYVAGFGNNLNAAQVQKIVNRIFKVNGWETLSVRSFNKFINENQDILTPGRRGKRVAMNTVAMQNKRKRPPFPTIYVTLDGWTVELMYREYNTRERKWDYKRLVVVVVLDAYNDYPLGYAIGERETADLIREACRNAIIHTKELFGQPYSPMQVQSDNYQIKNLTPFYQAMAGKYFTPAAVGNSKAKVVEPYFKYLNEKCQAECMNWSGFNVDATKEKQVNREWLNKVKDQFPDKAGVERQIHQLMSGERAEKGADYIAKWQELPEADRCPVSVMDYLTMFGVPLGDRTNTITGQGVVKTIDGVTYTYDSFDPLFRQNLHIDWTLIGDPENMGRVLAVSPDKKLRFVLEEKHQVAMDIYSRTEADVQELKRVAEWNKTYTERVIKLNAEAADTVRELVNEMPALPSEEDGKAMQLMFTQNGQQKEGIQDAKGLVLRQAQDALRQAQDDKKKKVQRKLESKLRQEQAASEASRHDKHLEFITAGVDFEGYQ